MASEQPQLDRVSSPVATGQGGAFFEQHVDAAFLALLLVRGIPPILTDSQIVEVSFQTERLGRKTDDVLLRCQTGGGRTRHLNGQVKKAFTVSASNEECVNTFRDFWTDFNNSDRFTRGYDAFAIITRHGSTLLLEHFGASVDCAASPRAQPSSSIGCRRQVCLARRRSSTQMTFEQSSARPMQALSTTTIIGSSSSRPCVSFDLNSSTRHTESLLRTMLAQTAMGVDAVGAAESTWLRLLELVGREGMPQSGTYTWQDLPEDLRARHAAIPSSHHAALQTLRDRTRTLRRGIRRTVGAGGVRFHISRDGLASKVREAL